MPSISASDPAFSALGYWRGFVWAPQIQIAYWGLKNPRYRNVNEVQTVRKAMVLQAAALEREVWQSSGHICENFCPGNVSTFHSGGIALGKAECCGGPTYHWGTLTGFISLLEVGLCEQEWTITCIAVAYSEPAR